MVKYGVNGSALELRIKELVEKGCTTRAIALRLGKNPSWISALIKRQGLRPNSPWAGDFEGDVV